MTRTELLAEVNRVGASVTERTLTFWEKEGILPRPIRRWHDGAPRALYPPSRVQDVLAVRRLQWQGWSLRAIAAADRRAPVVCPHCGGTGIAAGQEPAAGVDGEETTA